MEEIDQAKLQKNPISVLSKNEARVLHSLIKWPNLMDRELHTQIGMKKSTFSSIKTRLIEQKYYKKYYIPNFPKIGFEMFIIMYGQLNRYSTFEERMRIVEDLITSFAEDFQIIEESNNVIHLSISQNLTEYCKKQEKYYQLYGENNFLSKKSMNIIIFPFELTLTHCFMDYEALIARLFGFPSEVYKNRQTISSRKIEQVKLTRTEKKVLSGLIQFPEESDTFIANHFGISRNTVATAKQKLIYKKLCFARIVPNLNKLNLKFLNFAIFKLNPNLTQLQRHKLSDQVRKILSPHFYHFSNLDCFLISAHTSLEELNTSNNELKKFYNKNDIITETTSFQFNIPSMITIKEFDFSPMTHKTFGFS